MSSTMGLGGLGLLVVIGTVVELDLVSVVAVVVVMVLAASGMVLPIGKGSTIVPDLVVVS